MVKSFVQRKQSAIQCHPESELGLLWSHIRITSPSSMDVVDVFVHVVFRSTQYNIVCSSSSPCSFPLFYPFFPSIGSMFFVFFSVFFPSFFHLRIALLFFFCARWIIWHVSDTEHSLFWLFLLICSHHIKKILSPLPTFYVILLPALLEMSFFFCEFLLLVLLYPQPCHSFLLLHYHY